MVLLEGGIGGGRGANIGGRGVGTGQGRPVGTFTRKCRLCEELSHLTHQCPLIMETKEQKAILEAPKKKVFVVKVSRSTKRL